MMKNHVIAAYILQYYAKPCDVMIDVGVNIAQYMMFNSYIFKLVIGFEPVNFNEINAIFEKRKMIIENEVKIYNYLLHSTSGRRKFYTCLSNSNYSTGDLNHILELKERDEYKDDVWSIEDRMYVTIDSLDLIPSDRILSVIKVDAEGLDVDILYGAQKTIDQHRPLIQLEHIVDRNGIMETAVNFMEKYKYEICHLGDISEDNYFLTPQEWNE